MYDSQILVERIKERADSQGIGIVKLHEMCGLSRNVVSQTTSRKKGMTAENLYSIADVLECSVDYLLGRSDKPNANAGINQSIGDNNIGNNSNVVSIVDKPDNITTEFMKKFESLNFDDKLDLMSIVNERAKK